jgi:Transposase DDE domain group 1
MVEQHRTFESLVATKLTKKPFGKDLIAFTQGLVLEGELAKAEPKRLRYTLLHTAGRLTTSSRRTTLRLQSEWPWATALADAFAKLRLLPLIT